jgi:hypothetical protein
MRESSCGGEKVEASLSEHSEKAQCSIIKTLLGTTPMEIEQQKPPDMSARQRTNELIKLIRKLRWIGMEEEAERAETALNGVSPADSVLASPHHTD